MLAKTGFSLFPSCTAANSPGNKVLSAHKGWAGARRSACLAPARLRAEDSAVRHYDYHLLAVALTMQLVMLAIDLPGRWTDVANLAFAPVVAILLGSITGRRRDLWILLVLAALGPVLDLALPWHTSPLAVNLFKVGVWCAAPAYLASRLFATIYYADPVRHHELAGAVSIYLLLAYLYANLYEAFYLYDPSMLHFGSNFEASAVGFGEILYFSFVTLATLGYGDVAPAHPVTRAIAVTEAVAGLLYMAILVARFVSLLTVQRRDASRPGPIDEAERGPADHGSRLNQR